MTNETSDTNPEEAVPCFALSKNDSYVMSASGGKISLFNMMTFKVTNRIFLLKFSLSLEETDLCFTRVQSIFPLLWKYLVANLKSPPLRSDSLK